MTQIELSYIAVAGAIFFVSTRILKAESSHVFALLCCLFLFMVTRDQRTYLDSDFNTRTELRFKTLGSPSHFHFDTNLINLFYGLLSWRALNPDAFDTCLESCNNVLIIQGHVESGAERCVDSYDIAADQARVALKHLH